MTQGLTIEQMWQEFDAFKADELKSGKVVFYDGPMDPLARWALQAQAQLEAQIDAAGGLEAWRRQNSGPERLAA